eukprot:8618928-Pyramimonas_sp.AAC.1
MGKESRDKVWLTGQPATDVLPRVGSTIAALPAEVGSKEEFGSTPAQPAHFEPPLHPIAARPVRKHGNMQAQT